MSTGQAVFIRSMPDALAIPGAQDSEAAPRRPSFLSTYSFGQSKDRRETIDTTASLAITAEKEREDDLETVLDTSIDAKPYDESGKRTYERACVKMGVTPISCCLRQLESSQTLDLSFYGLSARGVIPVAMALVDLSNNSLLTEGMLAVVEMLKINKSLTDLNLAGKQALFVCCCFFYNTYLLPSLLNFENPALKRLDLSWNGLEDEGASSLGKALTTNGVLVELDLSCNRIGPKGALELLKCFRSNDSLEILRVDLQSLYNIVPAPCEQSPFLCNLMAKFDIILSNAIEPRIQEVKDLNEGLEIVHGYTDSYGKRKLVSYDMTEEAIRIMQEYCANHNMSMVDMFTKFDADGSMSVTHDEFRQGLKEAKIPLSANQVDQLIADLDRDGDGEIDFSELVLTTEEKTGE
ncbi:hypothetical protein EGW08_008885 [Elysia chlorotica]|uniref:EF-hand domain-containing protein n=1 Tax=Elysia chlorotica TaxID=188477 RepID=A0A433TP45_ELYCH|nr:hypothetical protein EGW08_008885 [Elysia chlorotica]